MGDEVFAGESKTTVAQPTGASLLRRALELICSLLSLSHSIRVFAGKWQLIRNKLEELHSGLIAAENCDSGENPSLSRLVPSIVATVKECHDLGQRCVDFSYSGKLLMQSDLDMAFAKLDGLAKKLSEIYKTGILTNGYALVVSKPSLGASKEDMRFYVRDLLTRMKIGDLGMKKQALRNLLEVVVEDEKYVKVIVDVGDVVHLLVSFLGSAEEEIQEESAKVVSVVAGFDSYKGVLVGAGVIAPLVRVLDCGSELGKVAAARCLMKLTENSDNAWCVSAHGGVTALLNICGNADCKGDLVGPACGVLRNLVGVEEIKRFMVEEGAVSTFIGLVKSKEETIQVNSIGFIQNIASGDEVVRQMVIREGGIRALLRVLDPKWSYSSKTREIAMRAIENLCFFFIKFYKYFDELWFCGSAFILCSKWGGFMSELVKFLNAKSFEVREMAAEALSSMVMVPRNRKRFVQDDHNIALLLQLLDPEEGNSEAEVSSDAKRLVRKLSTNRFRSMLNGIWHS
ncbi:Armadillo-type fold [Sesbania bispinosa]|nr:Armadillo-type fold [Sesbania bispinosa]